MSDTVEFDPDASWGALERRMESEKDPRRRQLLQQVRDHMKTEISGQLEALMATLVDEPQYHFRGLGFDMGPKGRQNVHSFYKDMIAGGGNRFHFDIRRIVVDENSVVTEGFMRSVTAGADLIASGVGEVNGEPVDPAGRYVGENLILTVWPADEDGRLVGEDIWFGTTPNSKLRKL
ncbi:MAG: nuclear transport factor 2 family protein [Myxococcota bacterium]|nr:nuclear transport factor 2 family protein [Myxococcota bacterium]